MFLLYLLIISLPGFFCGNVLIRKKEKINLTFIEYFLTCIIFGFLLFYLLMFVISIINISFNKNFFIPIIILDIISVGSFFLIKNVKFRKVKFTISELILLIISFLLIGIYLIHAYTSNPMFIDEYVVWSTMPKNIYLLGNFKYSAFYGTVEYPAFMQSISAGYLFFVNNLLMNSIRILPSILSLVLLIIIVCYYKRNDLSVVILLIFVNLFLIYFPLIKDIIGSLYVDIPLMFLYTIGTIYFIDFIKTHNRTNKYLSILFYTVACLIKIDCAYLLIFNIFILFLYEIYKKKFKKEKFFLKDIIIFFIPIIGYFSYYFYMKNNNIDTVLSIPIYHSDFAFKYLVSLIHNMNNQFSNCIPYVFISIYIMINFLINIKKNIYNNYDRIGIIFLFVIFNILFLIVCYIFFYGDQTKLAVSFDKYFTRVYILLVTMSCYMSKNNLILPIKNK